MAASIPHHIFDEFCHENSNMLPFLNYDVNSPVSVTSFPDQFGSMLVPHMSEIEASFRDYSVDYNQNQEDCSGFMVPTFWPSYSYNPMPAENWAVEGKVEERDEVKVGRYSVEERKDRIIRYLKKRNRRNFNKTIKYACRKTLADKRVRVRGRFAKNNEAESQDEALITMSHVNCYESNSLFHDNSSQMMKYDEDYWLEAAMENLGQLPYLAS